MSVNPSTLEVASRGSGVQDHPCVTTFEVRLEYVNLSQKIGGHNNQLEGILISIPHQLFPLLQQICKCEFCINRIV